MKKHGDAQLGDADGHDTAKAKMRSWLARRWAILQVGAFTLRVAQERQGEHHDRDPE